MDFSDWWKLTKPAECDELKEYFEEAWREAQRTHRSGWKPRKFPRRGTGLPPS